MIVIGYFPALDLGQTEIGYVDLQGEFRHPDNEFGHAHIGAILDNDRGIRRAALLRAIHIDRAAGGGNLPGNRL